MISYGVILNLREIPLEIACSKKQISQLDKVTVIVDRRNYRLELYCDSVLIKSYKAVFGRNSSSVKKSKYDFVTPTGKYKICAVSDDSRYYRVFRLNFPSKKDAAEAFKNNYINRQEFEKILSTSEQGNCPTKETSLGADISIHGIGEYDFIFRNLPFTFNWTNGSIALSNKNIDELNSVLKIGTVVEIKN